MIVSSQSTKIFKNIKPMLCRVAKKLLNVSEQMEFPKFAAEQWLGRSTENFKLEEKPINVPPYSLEFVESGGLVKSNFGWNSSKCNKLD